MADNLKWYTVYEYDDKQQKIRDLCYNADGSVDYYFTYEYDNNGNVAKEQRYKGDGTLDWTREY
jgi:hypothetical protein